MRERVSVLLFVIQSIVVAITTCGLAPDALGQQCERPSEESRMEKEEKDNVLLKKNHLKEEEIKFYFVL